MARKTTKQIDDTPRAPSLPKYYPNTEEGFAALLRGETVAATDADMDAYEARCMNEGWDAARGNRDLASVPNPERSGTKSPPWSAWLKPMQAPAAEG